MANITILVLFSGCLQTALSVLKDLLIHVHL